MNYVNTLKFYLNLTLSIRQTGFCKTGSSKIKNQITTDTAIIKNKLKKINPIFWVMICLLIDRSFFFENQVLLMKIY